jgi:signal transduction histidine kinase
MSALVNDLLDVSAIESGKLVLERKPIHLADFIDRVQRLNKQLSKKKDIDLQVEVRTEIDHVVFDAKRLEQVLDNLLGNAFKFSHSDSIVRLLVSEEENYLCFKVQDEGQGIKAEDMDKLFGAFQKTSTRPTGDEESTGLGLSICKRIVDLHGGHIYVDSIWGEGTSFRVMLPTNTEL